MTTTTTFTPPEFWSFKPFFSLQPIAETREKQLRLWKELILDYCAKSHIYQINPITFPYFKNESINRQLSSEGIAAVTQYLVNSRNAEWDDAAHTVLRIMWKTPEALALDVYEWASKREILGTVYTFYELLSGDEYTDSGFHGSDVVLFRRALQYLESQRKCKIITGSSPDEDGVKFLAE
eukprot:gene8050-8701_t